MSILKKFIALPTLAMTVLVSGCNGPSGNVAVAADTPATSIVSTDPSGNTIPGDASAPPAAKRTYEIDALIYDGVGAASADTQALDQNIRQHGGTTRIVSSSEMNSMTVDEFARYGAIVWPGGYATQMSNSLTRETRERIRQAITERGVGYAGFCAGAFITGLLAGKTPAQWGLGLFNIDFPYYYLEEQFVAQGNPDDRAMVTVSIAEGIPGITGKTRELIWYGGPTLDGVEGVIARHDDGTAAIVQQQVGKGLVLLSGPHPEAPDVWKSGFTDKDGSDWELAWAMIRSAIDGKTLPNL